MLNSLPASLIFHLNLLSIEREEICCRASAQEFEASVERQDIGLERPDFVRLRKDAVQSLTL